ncbi:hypothetical protein, partial [Salmonella enterica]|uniref:hypothetical protein n=1 Tax=Salmonella enterica TaxID=28901 RepID=UPI00329923F4
MSLVEFTPGSSGPLVVAPNAVAKVPLTGRIPDGTQVVGMLTPTGLATNGVLVQIAPRTDSTRVAGTDSFEDQPEISS